MITAQKHLDGFCKTFRYLYDGEPGTVMYLLMIKNTYREWAYIYNWLVTNDKRGKALVQFFQNESPDGGGVHMGVTYILSRLKGHKHTIVGVKADELS